MTWTSPAADRPLLTWASHHLTSTDWWSRFDNHVRYLYIAKYFYTFWHSLKFHVKFLFVKVLFILLFFLCCELFNNTDCHTQCVMFDSEAHTVDSLPYMFAATFGICCFSISGMCMPCVWIIIVLRLMQQSSFQRVKKDSKRYLATLRQWISLKDHFIGKNVWALLLF